MLQNSEHFWSQAWSRHFDNYTQNWGRQAYYLRFILQPQETKLLEIGAGSFRDTVRLNQWGYDCLGSDFSLDAVEWARKRYREYADKIQRMDAAHMELADKSVDVSFHNGFFVLFDNDDAIHNLLAEQSRVTRRRIVCTVHNARDTRQVERFRRLRATDDLYDIRFFSPEEIYGLMKPFCREVALLPYGHRLLDRLIQYAPSGLPLKSFYRRVCRNDISTAQRIMAVGVL